MNKKQTEAIYKQIIAERKAQIQKWGHQNHPLLDQSLAMQGRFGTRMCEEYEIPTETRAKNSFKIAEHYCRVTWGHILVEEISEAFSTKTKTKMRAELIQVAAVVFAMIEQIDHDPDPETHVHITTPF